MSKLNKGQKRLENPRTRTEEMHNKDRAREGKRDSKENPSQEGQREVERVRKRRKRSRKESWREERKGKNDATTWTAGAAAHRLPTRAEYTEYSTKKEGES